MPLWSAERRDVPIARDVKTPHQRLRVPHRHARCLTGTCVSRCSTPPRSPKGQKKEGTGIDHYGAAGAAKLTAGRAMQSEDRGQTTEDGGRTTASDSDRQSSDFCPLSSVLCPLSSDSPFQEEVIAARLMAAAKESSTEQRRREEKCRVIIGLS